MKINEKLVLLRKQNNITQIQMSELLGVSRQAISKWESGKCFPSIENLQTISKIFDVSLDWLYSSEEKICTSNAETITEETPIEDKNDAIKKKSYNKYLTTLIVVSVIILMLWILMNKAPVDEKNNVVPYNDLQEDDTAIPDEGSFQVEW